MQSRLLAQPNNAQPLLATQPAMPWWPSVLAVGGVAFVAALAMAWNHLPAPSYHDEFSNLLVADTLRQGRLANPAPSVWQPFQSFHVLVNPSYASKYPLAPGGLIALGWQLFGTPAAGIWLGAALCAMAVSWAAAGCLPRRWAILAGLLLALNPCVHHQWSLSYMNGWLTAAMSAIVAGAVLRMRKRVRAIDAVALGIGVGGLALTRPFEGLLFTITAAVLLLYWWRSVAWLDQLQRGARISLGAAAPLLATFALMALHNQATTGNVLQMPYQLHEQQYGVAPLSIFQSQKEPLMTEWSANVPPTVLAFHYGWSLESYRKRNHLSGWCGAVAERFQVVSQLWGMVFCLVTANMLVLSRAAYRPIGLTIGVALLAGSFVPWYFSHYFAPSLVWLVILTTVGSLWLIKRWVPDRANFQWAVLLLLAIQSLTMGAEVVRANARPYTWADERQAIDLQMQQLGGQHLVLVRYHANHDVHHEWVYNRANLDGTAVLWARSWRVDLDEELVQRYPRHRVWVLEFDEHDKASLRAQ